MRLTRVVVSSLAALSFAIACSTYKSEDGPSDGGPDDGGPNADVDAGDGGGDSADGGVFHDITDAKRWSCFDLGSIGFTTPAGNAVSDGRFVYYAAAGSTWFRYDLKRAFDDTTAWTSIDAKTISPAIVSSGSLMFDGRYIFYSLNVDPFVARFDTSQSADKLFSDLTQWTALPIPDGGPPGIRGGIPVKNGGATSIFSNITAVADASAIATQYEPTGTTWQFFDVSSVGFPIRDYASARYDGHFLYFLGGSLLVRHDTTLALDGTLSWAAFSPEATLQAAIPPPPQPLVGLSTLAFDGRYVYASPRSYETVLRYDTTTPFGQATSYSWFKASAFGSGFQTTSFDGRFVYFVPGTGASKVARYDSAGDFRSPAAWSSFDLGAVVTDNTATAGFGGTGFDGRFVYLVPNNAHTTCRFDAVE